MKQSNPLSATRTRSSRQSILTKRKKAATRSASTVVRDRIRKKSDTSGGRKALNTMVVPDTPADMVTKIISKNIPKEAFRSLDKLHVSDMLKQCIRSIALSRKFDQPLNVQPIFPSMQLVFEIGRAVERLIVERTKANAPDALYGLFTCICGREQCTATLTEARVEGRCTKCDSLMENYKGLNVEDNEFGVTGNIDMLLLIDGLLYVVEIKSINKADWDDLKRPIPDHRMQATAYWWLMYRKGYTLVDEVIVIYGCKTSTGSLSPYKEFQIRPSEGMEALHENLGEAKQLVSFSQTGTVPPRVCCGDPSSPLAKNCPMQIQCFALS